MTTDAPLMPVSPLTAKLLAGWKTVVAASGTAVVVVMLVSLALPKAYTSSATFTPGASSDDKLPSGIGGLAGQFGLVLGGSSESPEFYARLLNSRYLRAHVVSATQDGTTLIRYYGTGGRPDSVDRAVQKFAKNYAVSVDRLSNSVRVDVELRSPRLAQAVTQAVLDEVDHYNSSIRRSMAHDRRKFVDDRLAAAGKELAAAESALQDFLTRNRGGSAPQLQFERGRLERRVQLDQSLYLDLARESQTAGINEVNDTPVISIVDPPFLPTRPSRPQRALLVLVAAVLGSALGVAYLLVGPKLRR